MFLHQLGIRAELDLQGTEAPTTQILNQYVDYCAPSNGTETWIWYTLNNKTQMKEAIRFLFDCVKNNKPLYFHCIAGADRTGTFACLVEALLGVSESGINCDYELTSFYSARARTRSDWQGLLDQIKALSGAALQDKMANYIASLGFSAEEINAFRAAMTNGTPSTLTPTIHTFTVTNTLSHASSDSPAATATQYQPYEANITPASGYVIDSVQVTMGGVDVTNQVWMTKEDE